MEEVEKANKAAVESCHRVLSMLSQPGYEVQHRNLMVETTEVVQRFQGVGSMLKTRLGHARARKHTKLQFPFSESILLDNPNFKIDHHSQNFQFPQTNFTDNPVQELGNSSLESNANEINPLQVTQQTLSTHYNYLQQQHQRLLLQHHQQRLLLSQHHQLMEHQAKMMSQRSKSVINLNFDSSTCTASMSTTRSFISFSGNDGNMTNIDGNTFHLSGYANSLDQNAEQHKGKIAQQHKRKFLAKSDEGALKCESSERGNISMQRVRRTIKVPATSDKLADTPPDDYSWRKYGQKPIKGSPYPRAYYKCSMMAECPAKKHVERCMDEPSMIIVTYQGDHNHPKLTIQNANE